MSRAEQESFAHGAFQALPEVDVAGLYSQELEARRATARELVKACREAGFFYLRGHRVGEASIERLLQQAAVFFGQSSASRSCYPRRRGSR